MNPMNYSGRIGGGRRNEYLVVGEDFGRVMGKVGGEALPYYANIQKAAHNQEPDNSYFRKALTSGTTNEGSQFIPSPTSARFIEFIYMERWARQAFGTWVIPAGSTLAVPKFSTGLTPNAPDVYAEVTTALDSSPASIREDAATTTSVTLTLSTIAINRQVQRRFLARNSAGRVEMENHLREWVVKALRDNEEAAFVNGDVTTGSSNINNAYDVTNHPGGQSATRNEHLLAFNGLRILATGTSIDAGGDAITTTDVTNAFRNLGKYAFPKEDVLVLTSMDAHATMIRFSQLETLETYGPRATIFTGEIGKLYGATVIVTDKLPNTFDDTETNSTGIRSTSTGTNTRTECIVLNRKSPMIGVPIDSDSAFNFSVYERPDLDRKHLIAREDIAFNVAYADAIVRIINIAV